MAESLNVPIDAPAMKTIADAATLALQAQRDVSLYRCTAVKISAITHNTCDIGASVCIAAPSKQVARQEFTRLHGDKMINDAAGDWVIGCVAMKLGVGE